MVWRETWTMSHPLQPAPGVFRRLQLFMDFLCVGHLSNKEASALPEVSAGGQVPSLPFGAGAGPCASGRERLEEVLNICWMCHSSG